MTEAVEPLRCPLSTESRRDFEGVNCAGGDLSGVLVIFGDFPGVARPGDFPGVPRAGDFPGVVCPGGFTGVPWVLLFAGVDCLTLNGTPLATPVLIARAREGALSLPIESDLYILVAEVKEAISTGGEDTEGPVEREFEQERELEGTCVGAFREGVGVSDMTRVREGVACTPPGL